jgi:lysyl-tRNA synthetase class 2
MDDTNSLIEQRKAKLAALRAKGIDPFKNKFSPTETCKQARDNYAEGREVAVAGRITAHREMGKSMFIDVRDQSGRIQIYAQKNTLGDEQWSIFSHLDLGDFIGARGKMFTTKTGEISIKLESFVILAKALRPPPAKWHGLEDTEIRYRQRYLDLMANPEVKDIFLKRSEIIREIRNFLHSRGFVEVETPMMQVIPGGAAAQPFKTHSNALGSDLYLRIALELYLKRLLVGGVDKVFEIGRNFRNEGISQKHNPEFTMLEAYQAFGDYESMMELVESMVKHVAQKVLGTQVIHYRPKQNFVGRLFETALALLEGFDPTECSAHAPCVSEIEECKKLLLVCDEIEQLISRTITALQNFTAVFKKESAEADARNLANFEDEARHLLESSKKLPPDEKREQQIAETAAGYASLYGKEGSERRSAKRTAGLDVIQKRLARCVERGEINLAAPWRRTKYKDLVREKAGADWFEISPAERRQRAHDLGAEITKDYADFEVTGAVFEKLIEPTLIQPTFVTHLPKELVPLAKLSPDDPTTVEVFECCINGQEIAPAYTEQNDPIEQRERLEHQAGGEQQKLDEDFLVALEHGMPPAGGMGMGIDRLCMMLLGQESIRDVILFPQLKPK